MSIHQTVDAFLLIKNKIQDHLRIIAELRKQEKELVKEIKSYLNEKNEKGFRIDDNTYIDISDSFKKINLSKHDYEQQVRNMLYEKGIDEDRFIEKLLDKTRQVVQEQRIKIKKEKS
jgi:hypothetical protein